MCKYENKCSYAHGEAELRQNKNAGNQHQKMGVMMGNQDQRPNPMNMDLGQMSQFPGGMMMPGQMQFPGQGMYMDPNMNMQMMFAANAAGQGQDGQQFHPQMMPSGNQFMQMQQQFMPMAIFQFKFV